MDLREKAAALVARMTLEEKAGLCSGADSWNMKSVPRLGLRGVTVSDGPHGLRKQLAGFGLESSPATCFPAASISACSFDRKLLGEVGGAIAEECRANGVNVVLGPAMNIKRSPLCGRNFEYFSEDPCLAGELATAFTNAVQEKGVGVSAKHFALNNQETRRLICDSVADDRAIREIYLDAFERVVKNAKPWTIMCSYNKLWGVYVSENKKLLTDILRNEWGFDGLVVSDWGAVSNRVEGIRAGLDLEMPASGGWTDAEIVQAVRAGELDEAELDRTAVNCVVLMLKAGGEPTGEYSAEAHHATARRAAAGSMVLMKNQGLLPLPAGKKLAVIGRFAEKARIQGGGSSHINCTMTDSPLEELKKLGVDLVYAPGWAQDCDSPNEGLIAEAVKAASSTDAAVIFAGLPDSWESEGFDRTSMKMPEAMNALIDAVAAANPDTCVVLMAGGAVELPWADRVKAILYAGLAGQASGGAAADILTGRVNPSGKLAESWPFRLEDNPSFGSFPGRGKTVEYRESIYVGYRYYDTAELSPRFSFGHGLSYTTFEYSDLQVEKDGSRVVCTVKNTGRVEGSEAVQLYISAKAPVIFKPAQELKAFEKVTLKPGEAARAVFDLTPRDYAFYNVNDGHWRVEKGEYELRVGSGSRDIRLTATVTLDGCGVPSPDYRDTAPCYYDIHGGIRCTDSQFRALLGRPIPAAERGKDEKFTEDSTPTDLKACEKGRALLDRILANKNPIFGSGEGSAMFEAMFWDQPLRSLCLFQPDELSRDALPGILAELNS